MTLIGRAAEDVSTSLNWNAWMSLAVSITCLVFIVAYSVLARWWASYEGKVMVTKAAAIGLLTAYTFLAVKVLPESEAMRWARVVLVGVIGLAMIAQTVRLFYNQFKRGGTK